MSDRKPLFDDKIEDAALYEKLANDSVSVSVIHKWIPNSLSMTERHGNWWWLKGDGDQRIKVATLNRYLTGEEFKRISIHLSSRWADDNYSVWEFYYQVAIGIRKYEATLADLVKVADFGMVEHHLMVDMGLSEEEVPSHMEVFQELIKMANEGVDGRPITIVVIKNTKDINGDLLEPGDHSYLVDGTYRSKFFGLEFVLWREWLGMRVELGSRVLYGDDMVVAACLWEMTFVGHTEEEIQGERTMLRQLVSEAINNQKESVTTP